MKLHLGSGSVRIPGFTNVDIRPNVQPDVIANVKHMPMFDRDTADVIYYCHGLEHFVIQDVDTVLREFHRILKPGGWLYLAVPDFAILTNLYLSGMLELKQIMPAVCGGCEYPSNVHYTVWDLHLMRYVLDTAGFKTVERYNVEEFLPKTVKDYSRFVIAGTHASLNVRAMK